MPTSANTATHPTLQLGAHTSLRITKHLPFGLSGELPDGSRGIVREREIAWEEGERKQWRNHFRVGNSYSVKTLAQRGNLWELSVRLAQRDPWQNIAQRYHVGAVVEGTVSRFWDDVAVLDLEPGVTAFLAQTDLPSWVTKPIDEVLWVGDRVKAVIRFVDAERREIGVSVKELLLQRWYGAKDKQREAVSEKALAGEAMGEAVATAIFPLVGGGSRSILVIEDDPQQNAALCRWLNNAGHRAQGVLTAATGMLQLQQQTFDCLLCDLGLPEGNGIAVLQAACRLHADLRGVLMTDWASADLHLPEIAALEEQGVLLLLKPILPEELANALAKLRQPKTIEPNASVDNSAKGLMTVPPAHNYRFTGKDLHQILLNLRNQSRADNVALFRFDLQSRTVQITAQIGRRRLNEAALPKLIYSPVRDIAEDGITLAIEDTFKHESYVRYLLPLVRFRSCVGLPIIINPTQRYALLLFHTEPGFTGAVIEQEARAAAMQIRALVEQKLFLDHAAEMQRTVLLGHLSRALIHETNHQLNPILFNLSDLQHQCVLVENALEADRERAHENALEAQRLLQQLAGNIHKLVKTTRMFGRVTVQDQHELVRVDEVAEQCLDLVRDLADRARVQLHFQPPPSAVTTQTKFTQVQQVLLNLLLNSIQQIQLLRPSQGGQVHLSFRLTHSPENVEMIQVQVEDDGPGIHQRLWEQIFDLGMTTRQGEGSGMGLFIAQRLIENVGGRVYVAESTMLWGTRVVAEFPIYIPYEGI